MRRRPRALSPFARFCLGLGFLGQGWVPPAFCSRPGMAGVQHRCSARASVEGRGEAGLSAVTVSEAPRDPPGAPAAEAPRARGSGRGPPLPGVPAPVRPGARRGAASLPTWVSGVGEHSGHNTRHAPAEMGECRRDCRSDGGGRGGGEGRGAARRPPPSAPQRRQRRSPPPPLARSGDLLT